MCTQTEVVRWPSSFFIAAIAWFDVCMRPPVKDTIHSALITAFTIAGALIWKDVIVELVAALLPKGEQVLLKLLSALIATLFVIFGIWLVTKTETEAEELIEEAGHWAARWRKRPAPPAGRPGALPPTATSQQELPSKHRP